MLQNEMETVAKKIVQTLKEKLSPGQCTWGKQYPFPHMELFRDFKEDMVKTVQTILEEW